MAPEMNSQYLTQLVHTPAPHPTPYIPPHTSLSKPSFGISPMSEMAFSQGYDVSIGGFHCDSQRVPAFCVSSPQICTPFQEQASEPREDS